MKKFRKYTGLIIIWFAWLIIIAHQVIPHDHHSFDSECVKEDVSSSCDTNPFHNHGLPRHCHAFNELTAGETIKIIPVTWQTDYLLSDENTGIPYSQISAIIFTEHHTLTVKGYPADLNSLRAPPSLV